MKKGNIITIGIATVLLSAFTAMAAGNGQEKQDVCHFTGNGDVLRITIAAPAVNAHVKKGDYLPFDVWPDFDDDGYGDATAEAANVCVPADYEIDNDLDCNDADASVSPDAEEICDGIDNECDGEIDEAGVCVSCPCFNAEDLAAINPTTCNSNPDVARISTVAGSAVCGGEKTKTTANSASVRSFCSWSGSRASNQCAVENTGTVRVSPDEMATCEQLIADRCAE